MSHDEGGGVPFRQLHDATEYKLQRLKSVSNMHVVEMIQLDPQGKLVFSLFVIPALKKIIIGACAREDSILYVNTDSLIYEMKDAE